MKYFYEQLNATNKELLLISALKHKDFQTHCESKEMERIGEANFLCKLCCSLAHGEAGRSPAPCLWFIFQVGIMKWGLPRLVLPALEGC